MYQYSYSEVVEESSSAMRAEERRAVGRIIDMLRSAQGTPASSPEMIEALYYLRRLWSIWMDDLNNPENDLAEATRANLISIGIWVNKEIDLIQSSAKTDLTALIAINDTLRDGLK